MSGRVSIKCPVCKEWLTRLDDLCENCIVTQVRVSDKVGE